MRGQRARGWARAALVAVAVLAADQAAKALVRSSMRVGERRDLVAFVDLQRTRNDGVAFGALGGGGLVVGLVVAAALAALLVYFAVNAGKPLAWLPTGMLIGGALGNVVDRVREGAVTDFVKLPHWPAFNVADMAITVGVVLLLIVIERDDGAARRT
ncbi:MAG TPA: signal peptidase II [Solirubrobacteraceae bacterium]|nr:signal peptidase II [Solirubrobacteraceae bacterium]